MIIIIFLRGPVTKTSETTPAVAGLLAIWGFHAPDPVTLQYGTTTGRYHAVFVWDVVAQTEENRWSRAQHRHNRPHRRTPRIAFVSNIKDPPFRQDCRPRALATAAVSNTELR
jgi:hypothetical protein